MASQPHGLQTADGNDQTGGDCRALGAVGTEWKACPTLVMPEGQLPIKTEEDLPKDGTYLNGYQLCRMQNL